MATITPKRIAGQLASSAADIYTVPGATQFMLKSILLNNTTGGTLNAKIYFRASSTDYTVINLDLEPGESFYFDEESVLEATDKIRGVAASATSIDYWISGGERA